SAAASPPHGLGREIYVSVNVDGTQNVVDACLKLGVPHLVYTSSASVVFNGQSLEDADETMPYCKVHVDAYNETKANAERIVLAANCDKLRTAALRPSGIFGPRDMQGIKTMIAVAKSSKSAYQLGNNSNLMDWTYVDNAAHAHILAANKLKESPAVGGQAFFVTNDAPVFFWDVPKMVFDEYGTKDTLRIVIPSSVAFLLALLVEIVVFILSPLVKIHPTLTLFRWRLITNNKYHSIEKAKKMLGYKPIVSMSEGVKRAVKWFKDEEEKGQKF
ncbi:hypothetical protein HDU83_009120, partial [Entophlyctis luteolus]